MLTGFNSSYAGMLAQTERHEVIANNLANANTPGFKKGVVGCASFSAYMNGEPQASNCDMPQTISQQDERQGHIHATGVPTDFALDGPGHFVLKAPDGEQLVRGGSFRLNTSGRLVSAEGHTVLGENGPINITGANWSVNADGSIVSGGAVIGKLRIEQDPKAADPSQPTRVVSGSIEVSNVNTVEEMVAMISALRAYEACQKSIQSLDQTLDKLVNQLGRSA